MVGGEQKRERERMFCMEGEKERVRKDKKKIEKLRTNLTLFVYCFQRLSTSLGVERWLSIQTPDAENYDTCATKRRERCQQLSGNEMR